MSTIGDRIYELRTRRGLTQAELGEIIGESKQTIYKYERGIITNIPLANVEAIAKALRCPPVALTGWDGEEPAAEVSTEPVDEQHKLLIQLFDQLPASSQELIIAQLRGIVQSQKAQDDQ